MNTVAVPDPRAGPPPAAARAAAELALPDDRRVVGHARRGVARRRARAAARLPAARPDPVPHVRGDLHDARAAGPHAAGPDPAPRRPRRRRGGARGAARRGAPRSRPRWATSTSSAAEDWTRDDTVERMRAMYEYRRSRLRRAPASPTTARATSTARASTRRWSARCSTPSGRSSCGCATRATISNEVMHRLERELDLEDERLEI